MLPLSIRDAGALLRGRAAGAEELARAYLDGIARLQSELNAFITELGGRALRIAAQRDAELRRGRDRGPLHGIPVVVKDIFEISGTVTTAGCAAFASRRTRGTATAVRLLEEAGAVVLGKTNMNELAAGLSGTNLHFGDTRNPWDFRRSPGGSSSGTAAAVAAGLCLGGLGTDTGGSIRVPASWCGIAGMRPTPGLVSLHGVFPRAPSLDTAGPLARNVEDLAYLLDAIAGRDPTDARSAAVRRPRSYAAGLGKGVEGLRFGIVGNFTFRDVEAPIAAAIGVAARTFETLGGEIVELELPALAGDIAYDRLFSDLLLYEFKRVFAARFRKTPSAMAACGPIVQDDLRAAACITREEYQACLARRPQVAARLRRVFKEVDALLMPASPISPPLLAAGAEQFARARQFTIPFSYAGLPSVVVPCGFAPGGLPIGLQIVADRHREAALLRIAAAFEAEAGLRERRPAAFCG